MMDLCDTGQDREKIKITRRSREVSGLDPRHGLDEKEKELMERLILLYEGNESNPQACTPKESAKHWDKYSDIPILEFIISIFESQQEETDYLYQRIDELQNELDKTNRLDLSVNGSGQQGGK
jgi:hypothetical protein